MTSPIITPFLIFGWAFLIIGIWISIFTYWLVGLVPVIASFVAFRLAAKLSGKRKRVGEARKSFKDFITVNPLS